MADAGFVLYVLANICKKNNVLSDGRVNFFFNAMNLLSLLFFRVELFIGTLYVITLYRATSHKDGLYIGTSFSCRMQDKGMDSLSISLPFAVYNEM